METSQAFGTLLCLRRAPIDPRFDQVALGDDDPPPIRDAGAVIDTIARYRPDRVLSSDLARARATAEGIAAHTGAPLSVRRSLRPRHFGTWQGKPWPRLVAEDPRVSDFLAHFTEAAPPGGETLASACERVVRDVLWEMHRFKRRTVCLVGHADGIRGLVAAALGLSWEHVQRFQIDPFGLTVIRFQGPGTLVTLLNHPADGSHPFVNDAEERG